MSSLSDLEPFIKALSNSEAAEREVAVEALVAAGDDELVARLAKLPQRGDQWKSVARVLGLIGSERAIAVLTAALSTAANEVCVTASLALADAGAVAVPSLIAGLAHWLPAVRARCAMALGRMKVHDAVEPLLPLAADVDWSVRLEAILALAALADDRAVPALVAALTDEEEAVRQTVPVALGELGSEAAIAGLRRALINDDPNVRWIAEWQLAHMADVNA